MAVVGEIRTAAKGWEVWDGSKWQPAKNHGEACQLQLAARIANDWTVSDDELFAPHEVEILARHMERKGRKWGAA